MLIYHDAYDFLSTAEVMELTKLDYPVLVLDKRSTNVIYVSDMFAREYLDFIAHPKFFAAWLEEPIRIESAEEIERKEREESR